MTRRGGLRGGLTVLLLLIAVGVAQGHRSPGSVSRIDWNPRSGLTEITHRLHVHDAALGVAQMEGLARLDLSSIEGQAQAALYVEARFAIEVNGDAVILSTLGAELRDDYLLVYQETDQALKGTVRVANGILRDAFDDQINEVNLHLLDQRVRTLRFSGKDRWQALVSTPSR